MRVTTVAVPQCPSRLPLALPLNFALYRALGWRLLRPVLRTHDLVHSVDAFTGILSSHWASRARIHHVHQVIGSDVNTILPRIVKSRSVAGWDRHLHGVACVGRAVERSFRALYPNVENVRTIYRGVNIGAFQPVGPMAGPLAARPPVRYLFLGGFPEYPTLPNRANTKGGETLLEAWRMAEPEMAATNASLLIAGPASESDRVRRWRAALRQPERVHIGGLISPEAVAAYIRASDVVLLPSMEEGLPGVAVEASACGRAVFGSLVGGIPEVVVDRETGVLLPAGDVAAWKTALATYARRPSPLAAMGDSARRRIGTFFNADRYAPQLLNLYGAALSASL